MNAILYNSDTSSTDTEEVFEEAKQIIENNSNGTFKEPKKKHTKGIVITICILILLIILGMLSTIFALLNINSDKIISGISILGIDVSGFTQEEATAKVSENLNSRLETNLVFSHNCALYNVLPSQLECSYDISKAVSEAYSCGRNGNIFKNNFDILNTLINTVDINVDFSYNNDLYESVVTQMNTNFEDGLKQSSYTIDGNNLIITSGKAGNVIISEKLKDLIVDKLTSTNYNTDPIEVPVEEAQPDPIDIDKIHSEIYKEAKDAYYTKDPFAVYPSSNGLDFDISVDEAKQMVSTPSETYTIPLKTLYPDVTTNEIGTEAFPDKLATYSTSYA